MLPTRAVLLLRISDDKAGDERGVGRQEHDGRGLADRLRWTIGPAETHVITENDVSAFKRRKIRLPDGTSALRTVRPGFRRALEMLASGEADGLLAYDLDRVVRDPRDLEDLVDVVETKKPRPPVESVTGSLKLATDSDITMARVGVAIANKSSRDTARRVSRKHEELAEMGMPGGGGIRPYGYDGGGMNVIEAEAEVLRDMAKKLLDGWSLNAVAEDLNARGIKPVRAEKWGTRSVRSAITGPRVAGLRRFRGEVVGVATWPAIIERETWEAVCARIAERGRGGSNVLVRWLTGALQCSLCDFWLIGAQPSPKHKVPARYWCATPRGGCGKTTINAEHAEREVERQVLDYLTDPDVVTRLRSTTASDQADDVRQTLAQDEAELKNLARAYAERKISFAEYGEARKVFAARMEEARLFLSASAPRILRAILAGDVRENWASLTPTDKREVVLSLFPGYRVLPFDRSKPRKFDPSRLQPIQPENN